MEATSQTPCKYVTDMLKYLPLYERTSTVMYEILQSYCYEISKIEKDLEIVNRNLFISTAVELIEFYERDVGITGSGALTIEQRREQVISRLIAAFGQTTVSSIKAVAKAFTNGDVEVNPTNVDGVFEIKFVNTKGIPNNMEGLKRSLALIIPAHIQINYTFVFNTWDDVKGRTWQEVSTLSWDEIRTQ